MQDEIINIDELMKILHIGRNTAYRLLDNGEVRAFKIGKVWKIQKSAVQEYIEEQTKETQKTN